MGITLKRIERAIRQENAYRSGFRLLAICCVIRFVICLAICALRGGPS